jgi:hypothetical protein
MALNRFGYFHYTLMVHSYGSGSSSSGYAEIRGDDLIVSLGCSNTMEFVSNTIAHELGHNLNLRHGGSDDRNNKRNYNSIMNYRYQFPGVDTNCDTEGDQVLDYSLGENLVLNESALSESAGVCADPSSPAIDFNFNGFIDQGLVSYDVNYDGFLTQLTDHDDWSAIVYDWDSTFGGAGLASAFRVQEATACPAPPAL